MRWFSIVGKPTLKITQKNSRRNMLLCLSDTSLSENTQIARHG